MNPVLAQALGSVVRWALAIGAGYLIKAGIWSKEDAASYVTAGTLALIALGWSLWQKYQARQKLVTALAMPKTTEKKVETMVDKGKAPSITTPVDKVPVVPPSEKK